MRRFVLTPRWLQFLIIVLLVVGVFFRFVNLDGKVYWHDEIYTSLRISGYTAAEVREQIFNGRVISKEAFAQFQRLNPETNLGDTIKSLAIEDPQHPPLYYVLARFWVQIFGDSITAIRILSAIISLLVFPCAYWLCQELFKVPLSVPGIAIALMAISPLHLVFAQEAREYMLWAVTILLSSAALLRALRLESTRQTEEFRVFNWGIYSVALAVSLYTFLLSGFVAVAHGTYVIATEKFRWAKTVKAYLLASLAGFLVFMPWILVVLANQAKLESTTAWTKRDFPLENLIKSWLMQISRIFFDLNLNWTNPLSYFITPIILFFVGYAIYFLWRTNHKKVSLFIITLIVIPAVPLALPDLIFGGMRSISQRYLIPSHLGIQLAVAYLLATQIYNGIFSRRKIWQTILAIVIIAGVVSYGVYSQAETWWNKELSSGNLQVAKIINQASRPLLISDDFGSRFGNVFSLSYLVEPKVRFQLVKGENIPQIPKGFTDIFLLNPPEALREGLEKKYNRQARIIYKENSYSLWKLSKIRLK